MFLRAFAQHLKSKSESLDHCLAITTPVGDSLISDKVYKSCIINLGARQLSVDLIVLDMCDFDVLLGMDLLSTYHACVDCHKKIVTFSIPNQPGFPLCRG